MLGPHRNPGGRVSGWCLREEESEHEVRRSRFRSVAELGEAKPFQIRQRLFLRPRACMYSRSSMSPGKSSPSSVQISSRRAPEAQYGCYRSCSTICTCTVRAMPVRAEAEVQLLPPATAACLPWLGLIGRASQQSYSFVSPHGQYSLSTAQPSWSGDDVEYYGTLYILSAVLPSLPT